MLLNSLEVSILPFVREMTIGARIINFNVRKMHYRHQIMISALPAAFI